MEFSPIFSTFKRLPLRLRLIRTEVPAEADSREMEGTLRAEEVKTLVDMFGKDMQVA